MYIRKIWIVFELYNCKFIYGIYWKVVYFLCCIFVKSNRNLIVVNCLRCLEKYNGWELVYFVFVCGKGKWIRMWEMF